MKDVKDVFLQRHVIMRHLSLCHSVTLSNVKMLSFCHPGSLLALVFLPTLEMGRLKTSGRFRTVTLKTMINTKHKLQPDRKLDGLKEKYPGDVELPTTPVVN